MNYLRLSTLLILLAALFVVPANAQIKKTDKTAAPAGTVQPGTLEPANQQVVVPLTPKTPAANKGAASIVFFYTGDSKYTVLCQETIKLKKAMEGYSKVVLLKFDADKTSFLDFSEADEKMADIKATPTKANLFKYIKQLTDEGYYMDIWIIGHGSTNSFRVSTGTDGSNENCTDDDIRNSLSSSATGYKTMPIRMVWGTLCYSSTLTDDWRAVGAKVCGGARYVNFYPNQFGGFADEWNKGNVGYRDCYNASNTASSRTASQTYVSTIHAPTHNSEWGNCPFGSFVLGDKPCAKDYFTTMWIGSSEWQNSMSGKENMNNSSEFVISGENGVTKNTRPTW